MSVPRRHIDALIDEYRKESREVPVEDMRYWNGLTEGLRIARRSILGGDRGRLYLAPDSGGDLCLWRDDPDRPGWPEHLAWQGGVDPAVWAIVEAVVPRRDEAPADESDEPAEPPTPAPTFREVVETCYPDLLPRYEEALDEVRAAREAEGAS